MLEAVCGGDIGGDEQRKGESKDGGEFMILNTTYCRRAFTGVYCEHMDGNVCVRQSGECEFQYGAGRRRENEIRKELDSDLKKRKQKENVNEYQSKNL